MRAEVRRVHNALTRGGWGRGTLALWPLIILAGCASAGPRVASSRTDRPTVEWVFDAGSRIYSSPVVADLAETEGPEILVVSSADRKLFCLSPPSRVLWSYRDFPARHTSTPTVADLDGDGRLEVLIGSRRTGVHCLDGGGNVRGMQPLPEGLPWSGIVCADADRDGRMDLYWLARSGLLSCHAADGGPRWTYQLALPRPDDKTDASLAVGDVDGDGLAEVIASGPYVVACVGADGTEKWALRNPSRFGNAGPVLADLDRDEKSEVVIGGDDGVLYCLEGATGRTRWTHRTFAGRIDASIAVADLDGDGRLEVVYGDAHGTLYCLGAEGGERWSFSSSDWIESAPAIGDADGDGRLEVVVGSADGNVYCLSATGDCLWVFPTGRRVSASPTLCDCDGDGRIEILVGSHSGKLYCLSDGGAWRARSIAWPCKRRDERQTACVWP